MKYTPLKDLASLKDKDIIEAVAGTIGYVGDPDTSPSKQTGKPVTKQSIKLVASDGTEVWCDNYVSEKFMERADKGRKVAICSTVRDGKMQGVNLSIWKEKVSLRLFGGTNITFHSEANDTEATPAPSAAPASQQKPQAQPKQQSGTTLDDVADLWRWCYGQVEPTTGKDHAVAAAATLFIEVNRRGMMLPKLTVVEVIQQANSAKDTATAIIKSGGCDVRDLPGGEQLDEIVDLLIDSAAESKGRDAVIAAFDAFVAKFGSNKTDATKALVADWGAFVGGI